MQRQIGLSRRGMILSLFAGTGLRLCASEPHPVTPEYNHMTDQQEIAAGHEMVKAIEKDEHLRLIERSDIHSYFDDAFQKIANSSQRPSIPYNLKIVDTGAVNAFALPGGFVYLYRGLIETASTEAEVTGALAHEVGHVVGRHGANELARAKAANSLLTEASRMLLGNDASATLVEQLGGPLAALALLKYDRQQELEADILGFYNVQRAGWHPNGMLTLFKRFDDSTTQIDTLLNFTSDHPTPYEREQQIRDEMRTSPPREGLLSDRGEFHHIQSELKSLPKPPRQSARLRTLHEVELFS